jgi:hypothetical protein
MSFSGQYAAAQLHHLPLPHTQLVEISDYLGHAPHLAPPTYVAWARTYGRIPDLGIQSYFTGQNFVEVKVIERDLHRYAGRVQCRSITRDNRRAPVVDLYCDDTWSRIRSRAGAAQLYRMTIRIAITADDATFLHRWYTRYGCMWPDVEHNTVHPTLVGAVRIYDRFDYRWNIDLTRCNRTLRRYENGEDSD